MAKQLTVTKIVRHSPQYGWVEYSDGVEGTYGCRCGAAWFTTKMCGRASRSATNGKRVDLLKQALAQAEGCAVRISERNR